MQARQGLTHLIKTADDAYNESEYAVSEEYYAKAIQLINQQAHLTQQQKGKLLYCEFGELDCQIKLNKKSLINDRKKIDFNPLIKKIEELKSRALHTDYKKEYLLKHLKKYLIDLNRSKIKANYLFNCAIELYKSAEEMIENEDDDIEIDYSNFKKIKTNLNEVLFYGRAALIAYKQAYSLLNIQQKNGMGSPGSEDEKKLKESIPQSCELIANCHEELADFYFDYMENKVETLSLEKKMKYLLLADLNYMHSIQYFSEANLEINNAIHLSRLHVHELLLKLSDGKTFFTQFNNYYYSILSQLTSDKVLLQFIQENDAKQFHEGFIRHYILEKKLFEKITLNFSLNASNEEIKVQISQWNELTGYLRNYVQPHEDIEEPLAMPSSPSEKEDEVEEFTLSPQPITKKMGKSLAQNSSLTNLHKRKIPEQTSDDETTENETNNELDNELDNFFSFPSKYSKSESVYKKSPTLFSSSIQLKAMDPYCSILMNTLESIKNLLEPFNNNHMSGILRKLARTLRKMIELERTKQSYLINIALSLYQAAWQLNPKNQQNHDEIDFFLEYLNSSKSVDYQDPRNTNVMKLKDPENYIHFKTSIENYLLQIQKFLPYTFKTLLDQQLFDLYAVDEIKLDSIKKKQLSVLIETARKKLNSKPADTPRIKRP